MREILFFEEFMMITLVYKFHVYNITFLLLLFYLFIFFPAPGPYSTPLWTPLWNGSYISTSVYTTMCSPPKV